MSETNGKPFYVYFRSKVTEEFEFSDAELEALGSELKAELTRFSA